MSKVAVVYWSGTGHTESMANAVVEGAKEAGAEVDLIFSDDFNEGKLADYSGIAFGCQWEVNSWKNSVLNPCLLKLKNNSPAKKLRCSVLTNGMTDNG